MCGYIYTTHLNLVKHLNLLKKNPQKEITLTQQNLDESKI